MRTCIAKTISERQATVICPLTETVKREINSRTFGNISQLAVERVAGGIVIRGQSPSFYLKQLALEATRRVIGNDQAILSDIEVK